MNQISARHEEKPSTVDLWSAFASLARNASLFVCGLVVAVALGEAVVRTFAPQKMYRFSRGLFVADPDLQYALAPNFTGVASNPGYRTEIRINSLGLRSDEDYGAKPSGTFRILAVGDSFTMGVGVEIDDAWVTRLERKLRGTQDGHAYEVINAGVPGYNTHQELAYLTTRGLELEPDLILLSFYTGNDIADNYYRSSFVVFDGYLRSTLPSEGILPFSVRQYVETRSHLYQLLWPYQRRLLDPGMKEKERTLTRRHLSIYQRDEDAETAAMWKETRLQLEALASIAENASVPVVVVLIPELVQTDVEEWETLLRTADNSPPEYDRVKPHRRIQEYCSKLQIPVLDLLPVMTRAFNDEELYLRVDSHWTPEGNAIAADPIYDFLESHGFLSADG